MSEKCPENRHRIDIDSIINDEPRYAVPRALYPEYNVKTPKHYEVMLEYLGDHFGIDIPDASDRDIARMLAILDANMEPIHAANLFDGCEMVAIVADKRKSQYAKNRIKSALKQVAPLGLDTELPDEVEELLVESSAAA